ncbi:MAG TPA: hypothetical protein VIN59_07760 [Alphaproteobacteria bacterium]
MPDQYVAEAMDATALKSEDHRTLYHLLVETLNKDPCWAIDAPLKNKIVALTRRAKTALELPHLLYTNASPYYALPFDIPETLLCAVMMRHVDHVTSSALYLKNTSPAYQEVYKGAHALYRDLLTSIRDFSATQLNFNFQAASEEVRMLMILEAYTSTQKYLAEVEKMAPQPEAMRLHRSKMNAFRPVIRDMTSDLADLYRENLRKVDQMIEAEPSLDGSQGLKGELETAYTRKGKPTHLSLVR